MHSYHLPFRSPANRPLCTRNVSRALIERPYSREPQAVGAVYDRPGFFVQSRIYSDYRLAEPASKNVFQRELHDSRTAACRAEEKVRGGRGDLAKRSGIAQSLARNIEPHGIGDVERLRPKLHTVTLTNREFSRDGFIPFPISGPQNIVRA